MIAFVTLFLGLVTGERMVQVAVADGVAVVELRLDGREIARLDGEPWSARVGFGRQLTTHELVAVARDAGGREVGRAAQLVNVPRPPVESEIVLDGWRDGRPSQARLIWRSAELLEPESITVSVDGRALEVADPERIELPPLAGDSLHFISAELTFPGDRRASAQAVFGGRFGVEVETELTAVPVRPDDKRLESAEQARGWLRTAGGELLSVAAIETGAADLFVVRDDKTRPALRRLGRTLERERPRSYQRLGLVEGDHLFLVSARPMVAEHPGPDYELFPVSRSIERDEAALPHALGALGISDEPRTVQRITDALAVAGVRAAARGRRRAVLAVLSNCVSPSGRWSGDEVRRYLRELRVPLEVWVTRKPPAGAGGLCPGARRVDATGRYLDALGHLRRRLAEQQVLWVGGLHLPRGVALTDAAAASEVVGGEM